MPTSRLRLWLALAAGTWCAPATAEPTAQQVRSNTFEVAYDTESAALPLDAVELWYTRDGGSTWSLYARDEDRHSPVVFQAEHEGLYGFFVVLVNSTGPSSARPGSSTPPHAVAFVDFTPPVLQLHPLAASSSSGQTVVQVRWTAIDSHFDARPIRLQYSGIGDETWQAVSQEPLSNTGRFDWRVPDGLSGAARVRGIAVDRGGNQTQSDEQVIDLASAASTDASAAGPKAGESDLPLWPDDTTVLGSPRAKLRVATLLAQAQAHQERGELVEGIARLREAVRLDPKATEAFVAMGSMLLRVGDPDRALSAFDIALQQSPRDRGALLGAALAYRDRHDYSGAAERLRTILRHRPDDAEIWMTLGDVAVFQGDELLARECYLRATNIDPKATAVIADAQQRLALLTSPGAAAGEAPPPAAGGVHRVSP